ncbi:hypothetical protein NOK12_25470 [Nocardioides sp. OK12]|uniref:hypothetical protein n=1 Tax=Nocardioides sp. OK12 TaxID=2758661 RepID=UPI0021C35518|nr:hypothetical protein [Nocardioides sp. OK12]GHJ60029.1 hypothetical protein NOK12_25470 [Nocardioides sp. OK12]
MATAFGAIPAFAVSLGVVLVAALRDTDLVATRVGQRSVDLGWPFDWIHQNQSSLDSPLPYRLGLSSPWEHPTDVSAVAFVGNVLIVFAVVAVVGLLVGALAVGLSRLFKTRS